MNNLRNVLIIGSLLAVVFTFYLVIVNMAVLPERIPTHFNFKGEPDHYSSKSIIWVMPFVSLMLMAMLFVIANLSSFNYPVKITPGNESRQRENVILMISFLQFEIALLFLFIVRDKIRIGLGIISELSLSFKLMVPVILITVVVMVYRSVKLR